MAGIKYRDIKAYKYQIIEDYQVKIDIKIPQTSVQAPDVLPYVILKDGEIFIKRGYAYDGPSGPTFDTKNFMRGSLVHDALYQLMRFGSLDRKRYRKQADKILISICREDGMSGIRCWWVYWAVRLFAGRAAKHKEKYERKIYIAP